MRPIPSTMSLRALESAARNGSLTKAAAELNITQSAVSHQIRGLEQSLGVQLLVRNRNGLALTEIGRTYTDAIHEALAILSEATNRVSQAGNDNILRIACFSVFATKCLIPELDGFRRLHPQVEVVVESFNVYTDFSQQNFDAAICYGAGDWGNMVADRITAEEAFPVCSPSLLEKGKRLKSAADLKHQTIIRPRSPFVADLWPQWLEASGHAELSPQSEIRCDMLSTAIQAAIDGLGIAMVRRSIVQQDLAIGTLVEPFDLRVPASGEGYYLMRWPGTADKIKLRHFARWLLGPFKERVNRGFERDAGDVASLLPPPVRQAPPALAMVYS